MMLHNHEVINAPYVTEKAVKLSESAGVFSFKVHPKANKSQIKDAIEALFGVKVEKVSTAIYEGKVKRAGANIGKRKNWKKALVYLAEGQTLEF